MYRISFASCGVVVALAGLFAVAPATATMDLVLIPDDVAQATGAVCLDKTSPGYYFRKASTSGSANKWVLFFQGGGWCYTPEDCLGRSKTRLGSNKFWPPTIEEGDGPMGSDPEANPEFHSYNVAYFQYCDGASFSGNADMPDTVDGTQIWYRGARIVDALLNDLFENHGLHNAETVLISGCSAGGLSTYLHADYVRSRLPSGATVKAAAGSGFFMDFPNIEGKRVYTEEMQNVFHFQNATHGVNDACISAYAPADQWHCMMAQYTYPHITTPFFILNSFYDQWQMGNVVGIDVPSFGKCVNPGYQGCNTTQMIYVNKFRQAMLDAIGSASTWRKAGNGGFLTSCWNHCAGVYDAWNRQKIGGLFTNQAVMDWFTSSDGSKAYGWVDCEVNPETREKCNPTCV